MNTTAYQTTTTSILLLQRQGLINKVKYLRYILFDMKHKTLSGLSFLFTVIVFSDFYL